MLDDELPPGQALSLYTDFVMEHRVYRDLLLALQDWLTRLPVRLAEAAARLVHWSRVLKPVARAYWRAFDPYSLGADGGGSRDDAALLAAKAIPVGGLTAR